MIINVVEVQLFNKYIILDIDLKNRMQNKYNLSINNFHYLYKKKKESLTDHNVVFAYNSLDPASLHYDHGIMDRSSSMNGEENTTVTQELLDALESGSEASTLSATNLVGNADLAILDQSVASSNNEPFEEEEKAGLIIGDTGGGPSGDGALDANKSLDGGHSISKNLIEIINSKCDQLQDLDK